MARRLAATTGRLLTVGLKHDVRHPNQGRSRGDRNPAATQHTRSIQPGRRQEGGTTEVGYDWTFARGGPG
jgi:hypothetical protein